MGNPAWVWDELLLACAVVVQNDWRELRENDPRVHELSAVLRALPFHGHEARSDAFRGPGSVSRKSTDIATAHPTYAGKTTRGGRTTRLVVDAFIADPTRMVTAAETIRHIVSAGIFVGAAEEEADLDDWTAPEGRLLARLHRTRERNPALRRRKIASVRRASLPLSCEVCAFDFADFYGSLGEGYIEVHHTVPLHISGDTDTSLSDLALLCSNCHRMCHRSHESGARWRSPESLRTLVASRPRLLGP
ncbi:HNH endonuclease [Peterkaempfera bronchialis]|uniref:HNH endonuclease n=1 Tax=Peterkaempfera bronchialis TaxID=2126346 RepID=A0A345SX94_9ACTN|nr:HNH endonuclease [Peterkaempfera bronchialis]AXI78349.1 HNH endonuclease [Peterkaempfera bronchialis]